jgi:hypothetical protein
MNAENIIPDIHRQRESLARACGFDVEKLMEHYRRREAGRKAGGHKLVSFAESAPQNKAASLLHDEPRKKGK